jgi:biotin carboxylase
MSKKLAILGANAAITMLIEKAKTLGYETHVFAWACGDPGEKVADYFYPLSIDDKDGVLKQCREIGICGICSITSDFAVPTVNYVARHLGLVGNSERTDIVARNKYQMRCALKEAGLYVPPFMQAGEDFRIEDAKDVSYPVIVKPTDRWSSKGVTRVDNPEELVAAVRYAVKESFDNMAIIEGFMNGPEYSAECICYKGNVHVLQLTQKMTTGYPHYIETGHIQPSNIPYERQPEVIAFIKRAVAALDIKNSAAHAEFRLLDDGRIGIIEIGARMGGDCIGTDLTPISTGMDFIRMVIDVAVGNEPNFNVVTEPTPVMDKFILTPEDLFEYERLKVMTPEKIIRGVVEDTNFTRKVVDSNTRHGYYVIKI